MRVLLERHFYLLDIVPSVVDEWRIGLEPRGNNRRKPKYWKKILSQYRFVHHKYHNDWSNRCSCIIKYGRIEFKQGLDWGIQSSFTYYYVLHFLTDPLYYMQDSILGRHLVPLNAIKFRGMILRLSIKMHFLDSD